MEKRSINRPRRTKTDLSHNTALVITAQLTNTNIQKRSWAVPIFAQQLFHIISPLCRLYNFAAGSPLQMSNNIQSETKAAVSCLCKDDVWSQVNASLRFYWHKNCTKNTINVRNIWNFIQNNSTFLCRLSCVYPPLVSDCVYGTYSTCRMKNVMPDTFWAEAHNSLIHQLSLSIHLIWLFTTNHYLNCEMVGGGE